jgi:FAD/FMN-containing dehydrogenase
MVATNAAGSRSVLHGPMRPWVASLDLVTGRGESIRLTRAAPPSGGMQEGLSTIDREIRTGAEVIPARFPRTRKNSSGYALDVYLRSGDVIDLVIGSEGTLGIITEVGLRLAPRPSAVAGLLVVLPEVAALSAAISILLPFAPAALELLDRSFLRIAEYDRDLPIEDSAAVLLVDFEGTAAEVEDTVRSASDAVGRTAMHTRTALDEEEYSELWAVRHAASPVLARLPNTRRSLQVIEDGCVPIDRLSDYLAGVHRVAADVGVEIVAFGHAGDGHLHVNALADTTDRYFEATLEELLERTTDLVLELGGTPSGEHGDGRLRTRAVARLYGPELLALFRQVKTAFDPSEVLNPGVIVPAGDPPLDQLKVGRRAVAIPDDIALALRRVEQAGDWGLSRLELPDDPWPR